VLPVAITAPRSDDRRMFRDLWISTINRLALTLPGPPMVHAWAALLRSFRDPHRVIRNGVRTLHAYNQGRQCTRRDNTRMIAGAASPRA
jgi:hypothetical protein